MLKHTGSWVIVIGSTYLTLHSLSKDAPVVHGGVW